MKVASEVPLIALVCISFRNYVDLGAQSFCGLVFKELSSFQSLD